MSIRTTKNSFPVWIKHWNGNSIMLVPKANGKLWLCLDLARHSRTLFRDVNRGPILNDILPRLADITLLNACLVYHNLELDKRSSYLTMFSCPFGSYRYIRLPFGTASAGNIFQKKIDELLNDMPNDFSIANENLYCRL